MELRKANINDLDEIYRLSNILEDTILNYESFKQAYNDSIKNDVIFVLKEEIIIGFIHIRITNELCRAGKILEIRELVIDEKYRNKNYGKQLLEVVEEYGRENNVILIEVLSASHRKRAHRFYEKNNYEITGYRFFKKLN